MQSFTVQLVVSSGSKIKSNEIMQKTWKTFTKIKTSSDFYRTQACSTAEEIKTLSYFYRTQACSTVEEIASFPVSTTGPTCSYLLKTFFSWFTEQTQHVGVQHC